MSGSEILETIRTMPAAKRRKVVGKIWEEFAEADLGLTQAQAAELDRRLHDHAARPADIVPWSEIRSATEAEHGAKR